MKYTKLLVLAIFLFHISKITAQNKTPVVFELFTSQGCSSCPPADSVLKEIKENYKGAYVLSYHVDYWNRLGWKDHFSKADFSRYQSQYCHQLKSKYTYTPQLVVNGSEHFNGGSKQKAIKAFNKYNQQLATNKIDLKLIKKQASMLAIEYNIEKHNEIVVFNLVVDQRTTHVKRGENSHRTLVNHNIVANLVIEQKENGTLKMEIPAWVNQKDQLSIIAITKNKDLQITAASSIKI
ncbi:DUF1223 domain-containing protein [Wenyingzhuangia sp. IMCC45533]